MREVESVAWGDRYFEQQEDMRCGRHAVNNLLGRPQFVDADLNAAVDQVVATLGDPRALHATKSGWYSHAVLATLFDMTTPCEYALRPEPLHELAYHEVLSNPSFCGVLVNVNNVHWTCLCKEGCRLFYVDSRFAPTIVSPEDFQAIIGKHPMSFAVVRNASRPAAGVQPVQ